MTTTINTEQDTATASPVESYVPVKIAAPTGEETINVPAAIASDDTLLLNLLAQHGVSSAENARIERAEDGSITLTKQAQHNG